MPAKPNDREYRDFTLAVLAQEQKEGEEEKRMVQGYASVFNTAYTLYSGSDYEIREQVAADAFAEADLTDVIFQYNHEGRVFARTSNNTLSVIPDDKGLAIVADLGGTSIGNQLYEEIRGGYTTKMSYGYIVAEDEWTRSRTDDGKDLELRTIKRISKVFDVSAVSLPANNATSISVRNLTDGVIERIQAERLEAQRIEVERRRLLTKIRLMEVMNHV